MRASSKSNNAIFFTHTQTNSRKMRITLWLEQYIENYVQLYRNSENCIRWNSRTSDRQLLLIKNFSQRLPLDVNFYHHPGNAEYSIEMWWNIFWRCSETKHSLNFFFLNPELFLPQLAWNFFIRSSRLNNRIYE